VIGVDPDTLRPVEGFARAMNAVRDIFTTPKGSCVLARDYGSDIPALIDRPMNNETRLDFVVAGADALDRWEPEIMLERLAFVEAGAGGATAVDIDLTYVEGGRQAARIVL
jgi:hypothetical protein